MIRGAIAFGLVLKIPNDGTFKERGYVVTTTLAVVIFTILFFGTFMPVAQAVLVPPQVIDKVMYNDEDDDINVSNIDEFDPSVQAYLARASQNKRGRGENGSFTRSDMSITIAEVDSKDEGSR